MCRIRAFLKWLAGRVKDMLSDKATVFLTLGTMLIPMAMVWVLESPVDLPQSIVRWSALAVALLGIVFIGKGWGYVRASERAKLVSDTRAGQQAEKNDRKRYREHYLYLLTQFEILKSLGGSPRIVSRKYRRWLEDELLKEEQKSGEESDDGSL